MGTSMSDPFLYLIMIIGVSKRGKKTESQWDLTSHSGNNVSTERTERRMVDSSIGTYNIKLKKTKDLNYIY